MVKGKWIVLALAASLLVPSAPGQEAQVFASVRSDTIGAEDPLELTVTVSGSDSGSAEIPRFSRLEGFRVVSGPVVRSQHQWVNGRSADVKTFSYVLAAEKAGQFTIGEAEVRVGDRTYRTQPLAVRVTSAPSAGRADRSAGEEEARGVPEEVFMKAALDKATAYTGQQVTLTYQLCTRVAISGIELEESPQLAGFWAEDLEVPRDPTGERQVFGRTEYLVYNVKQQALFPTSAGRLRIPPSRFAVSARSAGDIFGVFGRTETLYRRTPEITLPVKPLPDQGRPAGFGNAVGAFRLSAALDKTRAATGDALALRIRLEGQGNLGMIPDIKLPALEEFVVYSSRRSDSIRPLAHSQIGGEKTWEYVLVPKTPGQRLIPPLEFCYFNPEREQYETVRTPPLEISVSPGREAAGAAPAERGQPARATDINFIRLSPGSLRRGMPHPSLPWILALAVLPAAYNVLAGIFEKRRRKRELPGRNAKPRALDELKKAEKAGRTEPRRFYDGAAAALCGYLAGRFSLAGIEMTEDGLDRALAARAIAPAVIEQTKACLQECDFGRFVSASPEKMPKLSERIRRTIEDLDART